MSFDLLILILIALGLVCLVIAKNGIFDPLSIIVAFYYYFSFGTIINYAIGNSIYSGIIADQIYNAAWIFVLGIAGISIVAIYKKPVNRGRQIAEAESGLINCEIYEIVLFVLILIQFFIYLKCNWIFSSLSKIEKIRIMTPLMHYNILLLQSFVISFGVIVKQTHRVKALEILNVILYVVYCLSFQERDFILIFVAILAFILQYKMKKYGETTINNMILNISVLIIFLSAIILGSYLFAQRNIQNANTVTMEQILNQGSILFINTNILEMTKTGRQPFLHGSTYLNSVCNILPSVLYHTDMQLVSWFRNFYSPWSESSYGFALDSEAYLNFGYVGVLPVFVLLSVVQRWINAKVNKSIMFRYLSVYYMIAFLNALRNDSLGFVKGCIYAYVFYKIIMLASSVLRTGYYRPSYLDGKK